jgi:META domain
MPDLASAASPKRGTVRAAIVLWSAIAIVGLAVLLLGGTKTPAHDVELSGSSWVVAEIDGKAVNGSTSVAFQSPDERVTLDTGCRTLVLSYFLDTDSPGIGFRVNDSAAACASDRASVDELIVQAFTTTTEWSVQSQQQVTMTGQHTMILRRSAG